MLRSLHRSKVATTLKGGLDVEIAYQIRELTLPEALARLGVVSLIQLVGFGATWTLVKWGPWWISATTEAPWQRDCLEIVFYFGLGTLLALFITLIFGFLWSWSARFPEIVIRSIFGINTIFFVLGMVRTGGPAHSFFAQLI